MSKFFKIKKNIKNERGDISILIAVLILSTVIVIVFGVSYVIVNLLKTSVQLEGSLQAFYAADAGIERILMDRESPTDLSDYLDLNDNGVQDDDDSFYDVSVFSSDDPACPADNFCIKSIGKYKEIRRAIEIQY